MRASTPFSSNRHTHTAVAVEDHRAKLLPSPSQVAPSGNGRPGQVAATAGIATGRLTLVPSVVPAGADERRADRGLAGWPLARAGLLGALARPSAGSAALEEFF